MPLTAPPTQVGPPIVTNPLADNANYVITAPNFTPQSGVAYFLRRVNGGIEVDLGTIAPNETKEDYSPASGYNWRIDATGDVEETVVRTVSTEGELNT